MASQGRGLYGSELGGNRVRAAAAEAIGTAILVYGGTAVVVGAALHRATAGGAYDSLAIALAFGLVLAALVAALGHVSGAHLNPAVTLGLAATGKFPRSYVGGYLGAQLGGAIVGALATWLTFGGPGRSKAHLGATYPGIGDGRAFLVEILITFILVFVIMAVATDERASSPTTASIAAGFALAVAVFIGGPVTGGAANPVRALGPMIVAGKFTGVWLSIIGPIIGGVLAALTYDRFVGKAEAPDTGEDVGGPGSGG